MIVQMCEKNKNKSLYWWWLDNNAYSFRTAVLPLLWGFNLWHKQLAGVELLVFGLHLADVFCQIGLQLFAAICQRFHLRFHLTGVETSNRELLLHDATSLGHLKRETDEIGGLQIAAWCFASPTVCFHLLRYILHFVVLNAKHTVEHQALLSLSMSGT